MHVKIVAGGLSCHLDCPILAPEHYTHAGKILPLEPLAPLEPLGPLGVGKARPCNLVAVGPTPPPSEMIQAGSSQNCQPSHLKVKPAWCLATLMDAKSVDRGAHGIPWDPLGSLGSPGIT